MLKKILLSALLMLCVTSVQAQTVSDVATDSVPDQIIFVSEPFRKNELSISLGTHLMDTRIDPEPDSYDHYRPSITLGYLRRISRVWAVGVTAGYVQEKMSSVMYLDYRYPGDEETYTYFDNYKYIYLMPTVRASWARHRLWNFYSRVAIGPAIALHDSNIDQNTLEWAGTLQISPLCFEIGNDHIRGFAELGFGIQGILALGIAHRF